MHELLLPYKSYMEEEVAKRKYKFSKKHKRELIEVLENKPKGEHYLIGIQSIYKYDLPYLVEAYFINIKQHGIGNIKYLYFLINDYITIDVRVESSSNLPTLFHSYIIFKPTLKGRWALFISKKKHIPNHRLPKRLR